MGGGIFTGRPFHFNLKCIIFSFYSSLLFYAGGGTNPLIIALIFIIAYVILAWYDFVYDCNDFLYTGTGWPSTNFSPILKPQYREKERDRELADKNQLVFDQEQAYLNKVYFFHALTVAPLLMYIGYFGPNAHPNVWGFVGGMGGIAFIYHGARLLYPREVWA